MPVGQDDLPFWLGFARFSRFGPKSMERILNSFPSMESAWRAPADRLVMIGLRTPTVEKFILEREGINLDQEMELLQTHGLRIVTRRDADYPKPFTHLHDAPAYFFLRGSLPNPKLPTLAVVGSRTATSYAHAAMRILVEPVAENGVVIVSGLARGIDTLAHECALRMGAPTIAVIGSGLDRASMYPAQNRDLAERIVKSGGAVISEYPVGKEAHPEHFPIRNRLIAALGKATLVVEGAIKSGSLITAKETLDVGRDVLAVPGPITSPLSEGPNALIRAGAVPATKPEDIYHSLGVTPLEEKTTAVAENPTEEAILASLSQVAIHVDDLIRQTKLPAMTVLSTLTILEMRGAARSLLGKMYTRG
ncbi:DNA-protecting protein DprA [Candidatus Uhrbacteria bacterium]|nr:DNA-protecting protein DprA [Candidatus Uhrbacteria bacterium]